METDWIEENETHRVISECKRGKRENWCYVVFSSNHPARLASHSNDSPGWFFNRKSQVICIPFYNLCRETRASRASDDSEELIFMACCVRWKKELREIDCDYLLSHNIRSHRQNGIVGGTQRQNYIFSFMFFFSVFCRRKRKWKNLWKKWESNEELIEINFKFQTFNPIKIDEEFTNFLNDSLCVVADETHT